MGSFLVMVCGSGTDKYWSLLDALLDGLRAYEARAAERRGHATLPLPVA